MEALAAGDPERIGGYWLAGRIGAGGQGVVYEAYDAEGGRYALKVLRAAGGDGGLRARFAKEVAAARRVASFCTARVVDADPDATPPYIVSEFVEGPDLRRAGRRFTGDDLHRLAAAVATALTAIHEAGVVHRDLKPDNVLLGRDGPRVIDFGIARTAEMSLSATGHIPGTPMYMAPEVLTGGRAGPPADVFAWGAVMVFAATGEDPFQAETLGAVMHRVLSHDPDLGALPPTVRPLVAAALSKDPSGRPTARELLLALAGGAPPRGFAALGGGEEAEPALGALAEDAYALLSPAERELVPELLLRLVAIGPDGLETVRPAPVAELLPEHPEARRRILEVFGYMLAERDGEVRLARPALLRAWPRLRSWVEAERDGLPVLAGLSRAAREWEANGRRDADLLQGSRLEAARDWAAAGRRHLTLTPLERDYLAEAGRLVRRRSNRRRLLTMALAGLLALSLAGGGIAVHQAGQVAEQRDRVADERDKGRARELAGEVAGLRTVDPVKAMLLSVAAWRLNPGIEGRAALTGSLFQREVAAFRPPPAPGAAVNTTSGDGRLIAAVTERTVRVFDAATGRQVASWTAPELARGVASTDLSGTGRLLAVVAGESVAVYETRTGRLVGEEAIDDNPAVTVLEFGGSDTMLNITVAEASFGVWDLGRDRVERPRWGYPQRVVPGPTGDLVVTETDGEVSVWRLPGFRRDTRFPSGCGGEDPVIGFSPDGGAVFCAGERFELWDAGTGKRIRQAVEDDYDYGTYRWSWDGLDDDEPGGAPAGFRLSRDRGLAVAHRDAVIRVWDVERHERVLDYTARGRVSDAWFDPGGRILRYRIDDEVVAIDLAFPVRPRPAPPDANFVVLSGDARLLAYQPFEGEPRVELWDVAAGRVLGSVPAQENTVLEARFDPAARLLALSHVNETVDVYDVATRRRLWHFRHPHGLITTGEAFSPDGRTYAAVYSQNSQRQVDYWLHRFDARTGRQLGVAKLEAPMRKFAFLPDGRHIVSELGRQVDVTTGKTIGPGRTPAGSVTAAVAVDPTGRWLAVGKADGGVTLWQAADRTPVALDLPAIGREAGELVFSPKGDMLAMIDGRERLSLWDVATRRPIVTGVVFGRIGDGRSWEVAFTPDGRTLRVSNDTGTVWDLPVDPARAAQAVCARAGRTLTRAEWREHLGSIPYRDVCAGA